MESLSPISTPHQGRLQSPLSQIWTIERKLQQGTHVIWYRWFHCKKKKKAMSNAHVLALLLEKIWTEHSSLHMSMYSENGGNELGHVERESVNNSF